MSKDLGGNIGCRDKTSSWHLKGFPDGSDIGSTVVAYPQPAFSAKKRTNYGPISFDQQV